MTKLNPEGTALVYSTYLRGENDDFGFGVILDASGDAYVTGETNSITFPVTPGAFQGTFGGYFDAFVTKLSPDGTALAYSTYLGKEEYDAGRAIAVDSSKKVFVTGTTRSTNFPVTAGAFQTAHGGAGYDDAFVAKLNPNGTALEYGTYLGGGDYDSGSAIAVEGLGNASVTGWTRSANFPVTAGAFQNTYGGGAFDAFVTKLNPSGTECVYSTYLGGGNADRGYGVAVNGEGNAFVTGYTGDGFPVTAGAFQTAHGGGVEDAFVTKFNPGGTELVYSTYLGGGNDDRSSRIALDSSGNACATGYTESSNFPVTAGAFRTAYGGGYRDAFVTKLNTSGTTLVYGTFLGGQDWDEGAGIFVGVSEDAYVTGKTGSTNFPVTAGAFKTTSGGYVDAFVAKLRMVSTALLCQALLQGHAAGGHAASLDVHLRPAAGGADTAVAVTSNADGTFSVTPPSPGSWHVSVKERRTLATVRTGALGGDVLDFGTLRAGDANNDNKVTIVDFSMLATTFGKSAGGVGYDDRADFNGDGKVNIVDFSLLASNFGTTGDAWPEAEAGASGANASAPEKPAGSTGSSSGETSGCQVAPGLEAVLLALPLGLVFWKP